MHSRRNLIYWALYDWANSAFSAVIQTFIFAAYFTQHIAPDETTGSALWGYANGLAGLAIALAAPVLGAIADHGKRRKVWLVLLTYLCVIATSLLWFATPGEENVLFSLVLCGLGIVGAELAFVFYNAMLPSLAPPEQLGKWSGWGWACGYLGGLGALLLALFLFLDDHTVFNSGVPKTAHIRASFPMTGLWLFVFSLPLFLIVPDTSGKGKNLSQAVIDGLWELRQTFVRIRSYKNIVIFLIARMFYIDGLTTLFAFGGVFAAALYGMNEKQILYFGIMMNLSAGIGAACFAPIDDIIGGKKLILVSIAGLFVPSVLIILAPSENLFWVLGAVLGIFVGPLQAASRSYMARVAPAHLRNEMFGFFAFSGKATAFLGPLLVGYTTALFHSTRAGISVILLFFVIGFILMLFVPSKSPLESQNSRISRQ